MGLIVLFVVVCVISAVGYGVLMLIAGVCSLFEEKPKPKPRPTMFCGTPYLQAHQRQPLVPGGEASQWARYALQNPEAKLQVVEKFEVADGQFTAEKHMKLTGPVPQQEPQEPQQARVYEARQQNTNPRIPVRTWWNE